MEFGIICGIQTAGGTRFICESQADVELIFELISGK